MNPYDFFGGFGDSIERSKDRREADLEKYNSQVLHIPKVGDRVLLRAHLIDAGCGLPDTFKEADVEEVASCACKIAFEDYVVDLSHSGRGVRRYWVPFAAVADILSPRHKDDSDFVWEDADEPQEED